MILGKMMIDPLPLQSAMPLGISKLQELTTEVVVAYLRGHTLTPKEIPELITSVLQAFQNLDSQKSEPVHPIPAVPIKKSVFSDYIICLEDGKKLKMLKRHLQAVYGMTPEQYRRKWGLPANYPMVAPSYTAQRSMLARQAGLGLSSNTSPNISEDLVSEVPITRLPEKKRGRKSKSI